MPQIALLFFLVCPYLIRVTGKCAANYPIDLPLVNVADSSENVETNYSDTVFIHRKVTENYYHAIYIDKDKESNHYKRLLDFSLDERDAKRYRAYKSTIEREYPGSFEEQL